MAQRRTAVRLAPRGNCATQRQSGELLRTGGRVCGLGLETTERIRGERVLEMI